MEPNIKKKLEITATIVTIMGTLFSIGYIFWPKPKVIDIESQCRRAAKIFIKDALQGNYQMDGSIYYDSVFYYNWAYDDEKNGVKKCCLIRKISKRKSIKVPLKVEDNSLTYHKEDTTVTFVFIRTEKAIPDRRLTILSFKPDKSGEYKIFKVKESNPEKTLEAYKASGKIIGNGVILRKDATLTSNEMARLKYHESIMIIGKISGLEIQAEGIALNENEYGKGYKNIEELPFEGTTLFLGEDEGDNKKLFRLGDIEIIDTWYKVKIRGIEGFVCPRFVEIAINETQNFEDE